MGQTMTITPLDIYLVSLADGLLFSLAIVLCVCLCCALFCLFVMDTCFEDRRNNAIKWFRLSFTTGIIGLLLYTVIPNSRTIAAMFVVPAIVNNEHIQNSAGNALEVLEELTKQWMKDVVKDKNSKKVEEHI